jgi:hypothetical protein
MKLPEALYHYTVGPKLPLIESSGKLLPTNIGSDDPRRERPVLWWSANSSWEPTATKLVTLDGGKTAVRPSLEQLQALFGCYRFRLDTRNPSALHEVGLKLLPWSRMGMAARISPASVAHMVETGLEMGAVPTDWWGCLDPVPTSLEVSGVLKLHRLDASGWTAIEGGLAAEVLRLNPRGPLQGNSSKTA